MMRARIPRTILLHTSFSLLIAAVAFMISAGFFEGLTDYAATKTPLILRGFLEHHIPSLRDYPNARRYFIVPEDGYIKTEKEGVSFSYGFTMLVNALLGSIFQPLFLSVFTPQMILNCILFPFFLYGVFRYFKKIPIIIIFFFAYSAYIGLNDSVVEAFIRHRMPCDTLYLLIGLAGLGSWITERLS